MPAALGPAAFDIGRDAAVDFGFSEAAPESRTAGRAAESVGIDMDSVSDGIRSAVFGSTAIMLSVLAAVTGDRAKQSDLQS